MSDDVKKWHEKDPDFVMAVVSKIFEWFNWVAIMGAIAYWGKKTHAVEAMVAFGICYALLGLYFFALYVKWLVPVVAGNYQSSRRFWLALVAMVFAAAASIGMGKLALVVVAGFASGAN